MQMHLPTGPINFIISTFFLNSIKMLLIILLPRRVAHAKRQHLVRLVHYHESSLSGGYGVVGIGPVSDADGGGSHSTGTGFKSPAGETRPRGPGHARRCGSSSDGRQSSPAGANRRRDDEEPRGGQRCDQSHPRPHFTTYVSTLCFKQRPAADPETGTFQCRGEFERHEAPRRRFLPPGLPHCRLATLAAARRASRHTFPKRWRKLA